MLHSISIDTWIRSRIESSKLVTPNWYHQYSIDTTSLTRSSLACWWAKRKLDQLSTGRKNGGVCFFIFNCTNLFQSKLLLLFPLHLNNSLIPLRTLFETKVFIAAGHIFSCVRQLIQITYSLPSFIRSSVITMSSQGFYRL